MTEWQEATNHCIAAKGPALIFHVNSTPFTSFVARQLLVPTQRLEQKLDYFVSDVWLEAGDSRANQLPLVGAGPWKLVLATCAYLLLTKLLLPCLMRPVRALELIWPLRAYNLLMVVTNAWALYQGARILELGRKCFGCRPLDQQDYSPQALELLHYGWLFLVSRLLEWLDTIFFVLRKRRRQLTRLHLFHHAAVPLISWTYLKYQPTYNVAFFPLINSLVHTIMYTYYLLATFGPHVRRHLWWKRHLTSLQIGQFVLIIIQLASIPLAGDKTCKFPRGLLCLAFVGTLLFLWLFFAFYLDTYKSRVVKAAGETKQREGFSWSLAEMVEDSIACDAHETRKLA